MKYSANEKIDIDKIREQANKKGISEKAKKYLGVTLLAAQIIGSGSALGATVSVSKASFQNQGVKYQTEMGQIFMEVNVKKMIDSLDIEEVKRRLNKANPEMFPLKKLVEFEKNSNAYLRTTLLGYELSNINLEEENRLKKRIDNMSVPDIKKKLINDYMYDDDFFEDGNENYIRETLFGEEKSELSVKKSQKRVEESIKKFEKYLENSNCSDEIKNTMLSNLKVGLENIRILPIEIYKGAYAPYNKSLYINQFGINGQLNIIDENDFRDVWLHEMVHAATVSIVTNDLDDMCEHKIFKDSNSSYSYRKCGFEYMNIGGKALNEGMTEYFSNKLLEQNGHKSFVLYPMFVAVVKDLVNLYGENEVVNAFVNSPERLEELMEKDGQCFVELMERLDECYLEIYQPKDIHKSMTLAETMKLEAVQKKWNKIGNILEKIKGKRLKENPGLVLPKSNWKDAQEFTQLSTKENEQYAEKQLGIPNDEFNRNKEDRKEDRIAKSEKLLNDNIAVKAQILPIPKKSNSIVEWFKNLKEKIISKFKKVDKPLLLNSGEDINSASSKSNDFLGSIKVNEEDLITKNQSRLKKEKIKKIEKEDETLFL